MATIKLFSLSMLAASAIAISTPALADWKSMEVRYNDLDLSSAKGQERLKTRITIAAKRVCGSPRIVTLQERADQDKCKKDAISSAMPKAEQAIAAYIKNSRFASRD